MTIQQEFGSVELLIEQLKSGLSYDKTRAENLLSKRYFDEVVRFVASRFTLHGPIGPEDAANSAFFQLFIGVKAGRYPELSHRTRLWALLTCMAGNSARNKIRDLHRLRRWAGPTTSDGLETARDRYPNPALDAEVRDQCRRLLSVITEDERRIVDKKVSGTSNRTIADESHLKEETLRRKILKIRERWLPEVNRE